MVDEDDIVFILGCFFFNSKMTRLKKYRERKNEMQIVFDVLYYFTPVRIRQSHDIPAFKMLIRHFLNNYSDIYSEELNDSSLSKAVIEDYLSGIEFIVANYCSFD